MSNATGSNCFETSIACSKEDDAMLSTDMNINAADPVLFTQAECNLFRNMLANGIATKIVESVVKRTDLVIDKTESERYPLSTIKKKE